MENNCPRDIVPAELVNSFCFNIGVCMLALIHFPGDNDVVCALLGEDLQCALEEEMIATSAEANNSAHGLVLTGEWDHLDDLGQLVSLLPVFPTKVLSELEKDCFHPGSYKGGQLGLR